LGLASLHNKNLVLEGRIYDDVPLELIGDVLRIRQVFTNLVRYSILWHALHFQQHLYFSFLYC
jgi:signal transduction histidine kinase